MDMQELVKTLNDATAAYDAGHPIITDKEWDNYYFRLMELEHELGTVLPDSPTQKIVFRTVSSLPKVEHNHPMLSLEKTKDLNEVLDFIQKHPSIAMCKMDGLTCSLLYRNGVLFRAETRGDGAVGEDITHNAYVVPSIPKTVDYQGDLIVDGEIICTNENFLSFAQEYKNPRNFAAGSIRLTSSEECSRRKLTFVAWDAIGEIQHNGVTVTTLYGKLRILSDLGFFIVPTAPAVGDLEKCVQYLKNEATNLSYPIDGIVFKYNDCNYYNSLGATGHHFRGGLAYKFYDETYETELCDIEWTMGRTGVLTPVAIFKPIQIDGATIERASMHNVSVMQDLLGAHPRRGQLLNIYKANQIIPQVHSADKVNDDIIDANIIPIPSVCPICGAPTTLEVSNDTTNLLCTNDNCEGKLINKLDHFCGKKGLDIKGLSKNTLSKLIDWGWVDTPQSIFHLFEREDEWKRKPGFGEKSVNNILNAIAASQKTTLDKFISAIGIPLIGRTYAKQICEYFSTYEEFRNAIVDGFDFSTIEGFGPQMADSIATFDYYDADRMIDMKLVELDDKLSTSTPLSPAERNLEGLTFVVTGKLKTFKNRDLLKDAIEKRGGKVVGSVTSKTNYLINNDINSTSSKNQTAKKLNIPIITEEEFLAL